MTLDIKICGLKTEEALTAALDSGASHIGFIFFGKSPRNVTPAEAGALRPLASERAKAVAVTVNADDAFLDEIVAQARPDWLQLHGAENPERVAQVKARYDLPVMKALAIRDADDIARIEPYRGIADRFLFDAKPPAGSDLPGGNGIAFDWKLLTSLDPGIDYMLSGGLNAANIGAALEAVHPRGIDISSGVERVPGEKDTDMIRDFFAAVRAAQESSAA